MHFFRGTIIGTPFGFFFGFHGRVWHDNMDGLILEGSFAFLFGLGSFRHDRVFLLEGVFLDAEG